MIRFQNFGISVIFIWVQVGTERTTPEQLEETQEYFCHENEKQEYLVMKMICTDEDVYWETG